MDKKTIIWIIILSVIPFLLYLTTNSFIDGDSYYYLNAVCNGGDGSSSSIAFQYLLPIIPCNFLIIKLIQLILYASSLYILTKIAETLTKNYAYAPFLIASTFLVTEFMKFENDSIGLLIGFIAIYFYFKNKKIIALILIGLGSLFWFGVGYWLILYPIIFLLSIPFFYKNIFWFLTKPDISIMEHTPWLGFLSYFFMLPLFYIGILNTTNKKIVITFILLVLINIFISKLWVLALPFGLIIALNSIDFVKEKWNKQIKNYIIISGIIMAISFCLTIPNQPFTEQDTKLIQEGITLACKTENCLINNDFSSGHTIIFYGGKTEQKGSKTNYEYKGIVIDINSPKLIIPNNCEKIKETTHFRLLKCNQ